MWIRLLFFLTLLAFGSCGCQRRMDGKFCASFHKHNNSQGSNFSTQIGKSGTNMPNGWNVNISSVVVNPSCTLIVYKDGRHRSFPWVLRGFRDNLRRVKSKTLLSKPASPNDTVSSYISVCRQPDWMKYVSDKAQLSALTIPGTHNTMARIKGNLVWPAKCQDMTLTAQLESGIRFLDIRCRHFKKSFVIHHGPVYQKATFDDVLADTIKFLRDHPSETILMRIKSEYKAEGNGGETFAQRLDIYLAGRPSSYFWTQTSLPTMVQARGKIIILRDFSGTNKFIDFNSFDIADKYNSMKSDKWKNVEGHLYTAKRRSLSKPFVTFCSGYHSRPIFVTANQMSKYINPRLFSFFEGGNSVGRFGMVVVDFANDHLVNRIISTNF